MNTMPTTQLDQAAKALHLAATTLEELHAAATAALLPNPPRREIICAVALVGGNACHRPPGHPGPCCSTRHTTDSPVYEPLQDGPSMPTNPANGMPLTEDEKADAIRQRRSPAMSPAAWAEYRQATAAPGHHTTQAMKEMGIEPGPAKPHRELALKEACAEADKLKNERDALGRILLRLGDEAHNFNYETVEAAAQRNTKHAQAFREIATFLDVKNNTTTEELKNRIIAAIHDQRTPTPPEAPPAPEEPEDIQPLAPQLDGRQIAKATIERIAGMAQPDRIAVELCVNTLQRMRDPNSCTRQDLAWGLNALHRLACHGNGNRWGNSHVNEVAQDTIRRIRETNPEAVPCNLELPIAAGYARPNDRGPSPEPPAKPLHSRWDEAEPEPPAPEHHGKGMDKHAAGAPGMAENLAKASAPAIKQPTVPPMTKSEMELRLEDAWGLIANAYGGDWESAPDNWQEAAKAWRDLTLPRITGWSATGKGE